jgi:hypothetical protein
LRLVQTGTEMKKAVMFAAAVSLMTIGLAAVEPAQMNLPPEAAAAMRGIDPQRIRAHVRFLSDDLLEGRAPGTRGGQLAADYIATQFALLGLRPAGDNGSYLQNVDFVGVKTLSATTAALKPRSSAAMR